MRTDIIDCGCDGLPDGAPVDRHVAIRILRLDIDNLPHSSRTNRPVLAAELRRIANILDPQESTA
nr:MAG TPA: hypothetical protein [Caudoviricetes sp.]